MKYKYKGFAVCDMCGTKNNPDYDDCWWCNENKSKIERIFTQQRTELLEEIEAIVEEQLFWYQGEDYGSITAREALNQVKNLLNKQNETK